MADEEETKEDKQYIKGFNHGYLLEMEESIMMKELMMGIKNPNTPYLQGLAKGVKEKVKERVKEQLQAAQQKGLQRDGQDRGR